MEVSFARPERVRMPAILLGFGILPAPLRAPVRQRLGLLLRRLAMFGSDVLMARGLPIPGRMLIDRSAMGHGFVTPIGEDIIHVGVATRRSDAGSIGAEDRAVGIVLADDPGEFRQRVGFRACPLAGALGGACRRRGLPQLPFDLVEIDRETLLCRVAHDTPAPVLCFVPPPRYPGRNGSGVLAHGKAARSQTRSVAQIIAAKICRRLALPPRSRVRALARNMSVPDRFSPDRTPGSRRTRIENGKRTG